MSQPPLNPRVGTTAKVHWTRNPAAPYVLVGLGVVVLLSSFNGCNKLEGEKQTLEERALAAESQLTDLEAQGAGLQAELTTAQQGTAAEHKQVKALQVQLTQAKQEQDKALLTQRQHLEKQSGEQLAKLQAALKAAQAQPAAVDPPQGDAGYVPNDTPAPEPASTETVPATPSESDLAFAFQRQCLDAVQTFFNGEQVNETRGGMAMPERWIAGSPYWYWNVNIRVSGTEHVEPFKCRSSRDKGFEALQGW